METTIEQKIGYIGRDKFVKFTNTNEFPKLSEKVNKFLSEVGIYSDRKGYPYLITDGKLKKKCISVFNHTPVMLAITSLSNSFSSKYLRFNL